MSDVQQPEAPVDPTPEVPGVPAGWYHDPSSQRLRWWDGTVWTEHFAVSYRQAAPAGYSVAPGYVQPGTPAAAGGNGFATASLALGIVGLLLIPIPFFIGLLLGGTPALLAVIFGIAGIVHAGRVQRGMGPAVAGLVLGGIALLLVPLGAGTIW